jgi:hypothetical protein
MKATEKNSKQFEAHPQLPGRKRGSRRFYHKVSQIALVTNWQS